MESRITLIPGDGIGPEIVREAVKVLDRVADKYGHKFDYTKILMGGCSIDEYGVPCNFHPKYEYSQLSVYEYADHSGFTVDYEMTLNSELVDLTLQLKFLYTNSGFHIILLNVEPQ